MIYFEENATRNLINEASDIILDKEAAEGASINDIGEYIARYQKGRKVAVITDTKVGRLFLPAVVRSLNDAGIDGIALLVPRGEKCKTGDVYLELLAKLCLAGFDRTDGIIALGGGSIGDLSGFIASTYKRGIALYHIPTTLLAMVDSSIGGKTAIDIGNVKNAVGTFYEADLILRDTKVLRSLPDEAFLEGMAEVIKYAMIKDSGLFNILEENMVAGWVFSNAEKSGEILASLIERCAGIKRAIVAEDLYDSGERRKLNFGHTVGHALEQLSRFKISHGLAVAIGMEVMTRISRDQGWCDDLTYNRLHELLVGYGYDLNIPFTGAELTASMKTDKKKSGDEISFVTCDRIGECSIRELSLDWFREVYDEKH